MSQTLALLLPLVVTLGAAQCQELDYAQGPTGIVRVSRPTVLFRFRAAKLPGVPRMEMFLNDQRVEAVLNVGRGELRYKPSQPLPPDQYNVRCRVKYEGYKEKDYPWQFVVSESAPAEPPEPGEMERLLFNLVNTYRRQSGLPPARHNNGLSAAASAHARYLDLNNETDHREHHDHKIFVAETPQDRALAYGVAEDCNEDLQCGCLTPEAAVRELVDAPYHRALILRAGAIEIGAGRSGTRTVLLFGGEQGSDVVVYPAHGQRDVPLRWLGPETPSPLRIHGITGEVGYVLSFVYSAPAKAFIRVEKATLSTGDGADVPIFVNRPTNDDRLPNGVFIIPTQPLRPDTTYVAAVRANLPDGKDISRVWSFRTEAVEQPTARDTAVNPGPEQMDSRSAAEPPPVPPLPKPNCRVAITEEKKFLSDGSRLRTVRLAKLPDSDNVSLIVEVLSQTGEVVMRQEFSLVGDEKMDVQIAPRHASPRIKVWWAPGTGYPNELLWDKAHQPLETP